MTTHSTQAKQPQPVLTRAHVTGAINALGTELVTLGVVTPALENKAAGWVLVGLNVGAALVAYLGPLVTALASRNHVTPLASPKDSAGNDLVPSGSTADTNAAAAAALAQAEALYPSTP
jgi:hypothetical protein